MKKQYSAIVEITGDDRESVLSVKILGTNRQQVKNVQVMLMDILKVMPLSTPPISNAQEGTQTTGEDQE